MSNRRVEVCIPGIEMGVEMYHRDRSPLRVQGPQGGKGDRMVSAEQHQPPAPFKQLADTLLDLLHRPHDVERRYRQVASVGNLPLTKRLDIEHRVVGPEQARALTDGVGAEPGARPVTGPGVERNPDHGGVSPIGLLEPGKAGEGGLARKTRDAHRVDRPDRHAAAGICPVTLPVGAMIVLRCHGESIAQANSACLVAKPPIARAYLGKSAQPSRSGRPCAAPAGGRSTLERGWLLPVAIRTSAGIPPSGQSLVEV